MEVCISKHQVVALVPVYKVKVKQHNACYKHPLLLAFHPLVQWFLLHWLSLFSIEEPIYYNYFIMLLGIDILEDFSSDLHFALSANHSLIVVQLSSWLLPLPLLPALPSLTGKCIILIHLLALSVFADFFTIVA